MITDYAAYSQNIKRGLAFESEKIYGKFSKGRIDSRLKTQNPEC